MTVGDDVTVIEALKLGGRGLCLDTTNADLLMFMFIGFLVFTRRVGMF